MSTAIEWGKAYARQAKADFAARDALAQHTGIPQCQSLHYLQMACEKLCKAHLCFAGSDPLDVQSSHAYVAKNLPSIARHMFTRQLKRPLRDHGWEMSLMRQLSREIELLAP